VYGIEGPGGYQLVGRTIPVWRTEGFAGGPPWLLRIFDQVRFTPVSPAELEDLRARTTAGTYVPSTRPTVFRLQDALAQQNPDEPEVVQFRLRRQAAFDAERAAWSSEARGRS